MDNDTGSSNEQICESLRDLQAMGRFILDAYAFGQAALLPSRIIESGSVYSGQGTSKITTASSTTIEAQTSDVEIIEGIYVTVTNLSAGGAVAAALGLTSDIIFPFTLQSSSPQFFMAPLSIPVQTPTRLLSVVTTSQGATYESVYALLWGRVAPGRTRQVH